MIPDAPAVARLAQNLYKHVGLSIRQAHRLAALIAVQTPLWIEDGCLVDPAIIRRLGIRPELNDAP